MHYTRYTLYIDNSRLSQEQGAFLVEHVATMEELGYGYLKVDN